MINIVSQFLKKNLPEGETLLLGLSGGPDSICLFYLLLELKQKDKVGFEVAHVNHGWRSESNTESLLLSQLCQKHRVPFHLKELNPDELDGNLEEACRNERILFFKKVCQEKRLYAVMLGHHQDDFAETVLKRIFEGAGLNHLYGLNEVTQINKLLIWRPLLKISKKNIMDWLHKRNYNYFNDSTNQEVKYLRTRLRSQIIPHLESSFGKTIKQSLCQIGRASYELNEFAIQLLARHLENFKNGPFGTFIDFQQLQHLTPFEIKMLIKGWFKQQQIMLSSSLLDQIIAVISQKNTNCEFQLMHKTIHVDRGILFLGNERSLHPGSFALQEGVFNFKNCTVSVEAVKSFEKLHTTSWQDLWKGHAHVITSIENLSIDCFECGSLNRKWLSNNKVPQWLKKNSPVLIDAHKNIVHEFLTGRYLSDKEKFIGKKLYHVSINYIKKN